MPIAKKQKIQKKLNTHITLPMPMDLADMEDFAPSPSNDSSEYRPPLFNFAGEMRMGSFETTPSPSPEPLVRYTSASTMRMIEYLESEAYSPRVSVFFYTVSSYFKATWSNPFVLRIQVLDTVFEVLGESCMVPETLALVCIDIIHFYATSPGIGFSRLPQMFDKLCCISTATDHYDTTDVCKIARKIMCDTARIRASMEDERFGKWVKGYIEVRFY